ncbi:MAG: methylenetetrahydrofolate--tRNA-(uracil(54)-C(5))-methyltransferase (FADH(2)-oxidizing) TrmFO [Acholeplasmatales bacterium]|nr:methylenetetrahydrofolate--tRNA-(uracil(54)-C(5))-methyltransferase (FADH(2)-oxidizing) TrmFO [Acholeplasmatales bacterium]HCX08293.1 methylenetetrahydrofolate--tRNA-(uracil(54)-C(5))-methyltransferase (FADH(2)-oxidizing) TrmFO [Acholeplasmatales bacterium]
MKNVIVIGAGLAGSEAVYQLAKRGYNVKLYEMRPMKMTSAHKTEGFAELICSNSLRAAGIENAVGLLKEEMRKLDSLIIKAADATRVEAGGALAVDRDAFSKYITDTIKNMKNVEIIYEEVTKIPDGPVIIASGPLTSDSLHIEIQNLLGENYMYFYDAIAPIVTYDSIDMNKVFLASRYNKGEAAYLNCPMNEEEFNKFYDFLIHADKVIPHDFEMKVFEGCMPIEEMALRGRQTLLFGPMKPVGLDDPKTGRWPYAVVQLRQDNLAKSLYNLVGFQTHLKFGEQKKLLELIPGLEKANIVRYGVMHRNTYINSKKLLNKGYQLIKNPNIFFAGQMTGVEGYVESASSGLIAGINMARFLEGKDILDLDATTAIGALANYISYHAEIEQPDTFEPMNVNFGIFNALERKVYKKERKMAYAKRALENLNKILDEAK